jgi:hypothetical protein
VTSSTVFDEDAPYGSGGTLTASPVAPGSPSSWSFTGDGTLSSAPIAVADSSGTHVYVGGTSGKLYALNLADGTVAWSTNVGYSIPGPDEQNVSQPLTGLAAGQGLLVVPAGNVLRAYGE